MSPCLFGYSSTLRSPYQSSWHGFISLSYNVASSQKQVERGGKKKKLAVRVIENITNNQIFQKNVFVKDNRNFPQINRYKKTYQPSILWRNCTQTPAIGRRGNMKSWRSSQAWNMVSKSSMECFHSQFSYLLLLTFDPSFLPLSGCFHKTAPYSFAFSTGTSFITVTFTVIWYPSFVSQIPVRNL